MTAPLAAPGHDHDRRGTRCPLQRADGPEEAACALVARQPVGRLVTAEEVARPIVSLASPLASAATGTLLAVDGGMALLRVAR